VQQRQTVNVLSNYCFTFSAGLLSPLFVDRVTLDDCSRIPQLRVKVTFSAE
jgi:hypothetical protein